MATIQNSSFHANFRNGLLPICEAVFVFLSIFLALAIQLNNLEVEPGVVLADFGGVLISATVFALACLFTMERFGMFQFAQINAKQNLTQIFMKSMASVSLASLTLFVLFYAIPYCRLENSIVVIAAVISLVSILVIHKLFLSLVSIPDVEPKVLVFGAGAEAASLLGSCSEVCLKRCGLIGYVPISGQASSISEHLLLAGTSTLLHQAKDLQVNEIVVALDGNSDSSAIQQLLDCKLDGIALSDPESFIEANSGELRSELEYHPA